jgi:Flp pilus assembly protein TadG
MDDGLRRRAIRNLQSAIRNLQSEGGYSLMWWAAFVLFVLGPLLAFSIEVGRYARAAGEVQKAADAGAIAAAYYLDEEWFQRTGQFRFNEKAYGMALTYANANAEYLGQYDISVHVTGMSLDDATRMVRVRCAANVSLLFPRWMPKVVIQREGVAEARMW